MKNEELLKSLIFHLASKPPHYYVDVELTDVTWGIAVRPAYCDRGRYLWNCESKDNTKCTIDNADGFPRYFFSLEAMQIEMKLWCEARSQIIVAIEGNSIAPSTSNQLS